MISEKPIIDDINQIADYFLLNVDRKSGEAITNLKIQKLAYYSQAWYLALNGVPLIGEEFEAWAHGPVAVSLYHRFSDYGYNAIPATEVATETSAMEEPIVAYLDQVWARYGDLGAKALERLTHSESPWIEARKGCEPLERSNEIISKESMRDFYRTML